MPPILERDRIPFAQKLAFGLGMAVPIAFVNSVAQMTNLIFNIGLGVSLFWLGVVQMLPRLWDAVSDPVLGHLSDKTQSRWGRRRPYIVLGGMAVSVTYVMIWWMPQTAPEWVLLVYYLGVSILFYTSVTIFSVPLVALGYEMTLDYHEKTRLFAYGAFFGNVMAILTPWMYMVANLQMFENEVEGMRIVALGVGVFLLFSTVMPGLLCREGKHPVKAVTDRPRFWQSMMATVKDRVFVRLIIAVFLVTAGFNFVNSFSNYIVIFYVYGGEKEEASKMLAYNGTAWAITALVAVFPMMWTSQRMGKTQTIQLFSGLMVGGSFLKILCYNPSYPWLMLIPTTMISAGMLVLYTLAGSMMADICNLDELNHGHRREGSYSAAYSWWLKVAVSIGFFVSAVLLQSTGYDESTTVQSEHSLFMMRFWEILLPGILTIAAILLLRGYPLSEKRAYEIKAALDARTEGMSS